MSAFVTALAYLADASILGTYGAMAVGRPQRWFHLANGVGCLPLIVSEVMVGAWPPLVLTAAFGIFGWVGVLRGERTAG